MTALTKLSAMAAILYTCAFAAHANLDLFIDCGGSKAPGWANTKNRIKVTMGFDGQKLVVWNRAPRKCDPNGIFINMPYVSSLADVDFVRLETNGHDAFWIDEIHVQNNRGGEIRWGVDNSQGWVLSTDSSDGDNDNTPAKYASECWQFNIYNTKQARNCG